MSGVIWTKLDYNSRELIEMKRKLDHVIESGINDRYRGADAKRDFERVYEDIAGVKNKMESSAKSDLDKMSRKNSKTNTRVEKLEYRVRHFQAQFPKKDLLP